MDWKASTVLVTGGGGFIGSHLAERLVTLGADVRVLVPYTSRGSHGWLEDSPYRERIQVILGDVRDAGSVRQAMEGVEVVFHLAALIAIPYSYRAPASYVDTNICGTLNVLQTGRDLRTQRIIHTSTSEVYGTAQLVPIAESHPLQGQSPYSATKIAADKLAEAFYRSFELPVVTVRPFNTFGPRQSARAVIPTIISQCLFGRPVRLGSLHPTRDLNYVSNTVDGFIAAAESEAAIGRTINLGSGREISVGDLAALIARLIGCSVKVETDPQRLRPVASEVERLLADNSLAQSLLRWEPRVSLEEGLQNTIAWFRDHLEYYRPDLYAV